MKICDRALGRKMLLAFCAGIMLQLSSAGQSPSRNGKSQMLLSRTYDTLVSGNGYGNYKLNFSQWDPRSGKLVGVRIRTLATAQYQFTLKNPNSQSDTFTVKVGREDKISGDAMTRPYNRTTDYMIGSFLLDSGASQSRDPYTLLDNYSSTDSIKDNFGSFLGTGKLQFTYSAITWSNVLANYKLSYYYNATIRDTARFSITYVYEAAEDSAVFIPTDFTVARKDPVVVYPNPATDFVQIAFNDPVSGSWQVDILAADGHLLQRNNYSNVNTARMNFSRKFPAGVYFLRATDSRKSRTFVSVFVIR